MSLFKKRKNPNFRQRRLDEDEEDETIETSDSINNVASQNLYQKSESFPQIKPQILGPTRTMFEKKEKKSKQKQEKKTTVLSFEDELEADDGIVFQEKKSSLSYKLRKEMKKERKVKKRELKETKDKDKQKHNPATLSDFDDLGIKIVNGREAEVIAMQPGDSDEDEQDGGAPVFNARSKRDSAPPVSSLQQPWKTVLESGRIPDANLIHQIRKERQKAREKHFIPLDDTIKLEENKSRLIREDENDCSDADEENKIQFSLNQDAIDKKQRREVFEAAQVHEGSDHEADWEMQQLRKSGAASGKTQLAFDNEPNEIRNGNGSMMNSEYVPGSSLHPPEDFVSSVEPLNVDSYHAEGILKRLKDSRESLNEVLRRHQTEADKVIDDLVTSKAIIASCNVAQQPLTDMFKFYQDMRGYVTDLRDCLNEKVAEIKRLEDQVYLIYRQRAQNLVQRRRQDIKDQNNEFSPFAGKAAKGDEYRIRRAAEREGRRTRRRRVRERKSDIQHLDGTSTDDEEVTSMKQTMQRELESLTAESSVVFEDVESDFSKLEEVMKPFEEWKDTERPSYVDAYVSFNLSKIFAPFIRLHLLLWNPLSRDGDCPEIEKMSWFTDLLFFSSSKSSKDQFRLTQLEEDPDRRLLSNVVEKVILPKIKELVACFWDPLSHVQSVRLVNLIRHYTAAFPSISPNSKPLKELMLAVIAKIKDAIENDIFIPMFPKSVYESKTSGVSLFFQRQFWSAWKLLAAVLMWYRIFNDTVIHELAIRSLLNLYLLPALTLAAEINLTDALDKTRHVINVLPREWSKSSENGSAHTFLGRLELFLVTLAGKLDPASNPKELKDICDLLKSIGARNQAKILSDKYL